MAENKRDIQISERDVQFLEHRRNKTLKERCRSSRKITNSSQNTTKAVLKVVKLMVGSFTTSR